MSGYYRVPKVLVHAAIALMFGWLLMSCHQLAAQAPNTKPAIRVLHLNFVMRYADGDQEPVTRPVQFIPLSISGCSLPGGMVFKATTDGNGYYHARAPVPSRELLHTVYASMVDHH